MTTKIIRLACAFFCLIAIVLPAEAQLGHPAKGTWIGHWGPDQSHQQRMVLLLDWDAQGKDQLTGTLNPGPDSTKVDSAKIDYDTWTMTISGDVAKDGGSKKKWVATGKLENLGSWTNRRYSGTYTYGDEKGNFMFTMQ